MKKLSLSIFALALLSSISLASASAAPQAPSKQKSIVSTQHASTDFVLVAHGGRHSKGKGKK
ncbi:MAG: hypothetical protein JWN23_617 [Rhodocyclales bacterium]|nr:hypothetical protein [Rhodocyclales bacterium]